MRATRTEIRDHLSAWHLEGTQLPRVPDMTPTEILEAGLRGFPKGRLWHADIGAGRGEKLDEITALAAGSSLAGRIHSRGSEIFLYENAKYRKEDPRILSPQDLEREIPKNSAALVTVIAPDPFSPNLANQMLAGISLLHPQGLIFARSERKQEALGLLLSSGFAVADLGAKLGRSMLASRYIPNTRLLVGWRENSEFERFLHENGMPSLSLVAGEERLKLLGWTLSHCGMHRNIFELGELADFSGLEPMRVAEKVEGWDDFRADPYLRRFERRGKNRVIY